MKKLKNLSIITIVMILLLSFGFFAEDSAKANEYERLTVIDDAYISSLKENISEIQKIIPLEHMETTGIYQFNNNNYGYIIDTYSVPELDGVYSRCKYIIFKFDNFYNDETNHYSTKIIIVDNGGFDYATISGFTKSSQTIAIKNLKGVSTLINKSDYEFYGDSIEAKQNDKESAFFVNSRCYFSGYQKGNLNMDDASDVVMDAMTTVVDTVLKKSVMGPALMVAETFNIINESYKIQHQSNNEDYIGLDFNNDIDGQIKYYDGPIKQVMTELSEESGYILYKREKKDTLDSYFQTKFLLNLNKKDNGAFKKFKILSTFYFDVVSRSIGSSNSHFMISENVKVTITFDPFENEPVETLRQHKIVDNQYIYDDKKGILNFVLTNGKDSMKIKVNETNYYSLSNYFSSENYGIIIKESITGATPTTLNGMYLLKNDKEYTVTVTNNIYLNARLILHKSDALMDNTYYQGYTIIPHRSGSVMQAKELVIQLQNGLNNVELFLLDSNKNVKATGFKEGNAVKLSFFEEINKDYYFLIKNNTTANLIKNHQVNKSTVPPNRILENNKSYYFNFEVPYNQKYNLSSNSTIKLLNKQTANFEVVNGLNTMYKGENYIIEVKGEGIIFNFTPNLTPDIVSANIGYQEGTQNNLNNFYMFTPQVSSHYLLNISQKYDIYFNNTLLAKDTNSNFYFESNKLYYILEKSVDKVFSINLVTTNIQQDSALTHNSSQFKTYKFSINETKRLDIVGANLPQYTIYNSNFSKINRNMGYKLTAGTYYINMANGNSAIALKKFIKNVKLTVVLDSDATIKDNKKVYNVNYGDIVTINTPSKYGFDFNGYICSAYSASALLFDKNGTSQVLEFSNAKESDTLAYTIEPRWTAANVFIKVEGDSINMWYNGANLTTSKPDKVLLGNDWGTFLINFGNNFEASSVGKKAGHFVDKYDIIIDKANDTYIIKPYYLKERYKVTFVYNLNSIVKTMSNYVEFDSVINNLQADITNPTVSHWTFDGWKVNNIQVSVTNGGKWQDLTPNSADNYKKTDYGYTIVSVLGQWHLTPYTLRFYRNNVLLNTEITNNVDGYTVKNYINYGLSLNDVNGYNLTWLSNNINYKTNDVIYPTKNLDFNLNLIEKEILIKYLLDTNESFIGNVSTPYFHYKLNNGNYVLAKADIAGSAYGGWQFGSKIVKELNKETFLSVDWTQISSLDITPVWTTIYQSNSASNKTWNLKLENTQNKNKVNIYLGTYTRNVIFNIYEGMDEVTIRGDGLIVDIKINIYANNVLLILKDAVLAGKANNSVLDANVPFRIHTIGNSTLSGGEINNDSYTDTAALYCRGITFTGDYLTIKGGNGIGFNISAKKGVNGGAALKNYNASDKMVFKAKQVSFVGGNGGSALLFYINNTDMNPPPKASKGNEGYRGNNGKNAIDQGHAGHGGSGIVFHGTISIATASKVKVSGGNGGLSLHGQNGQNGQIGGEGADAVVFSANSTKGGRGGDGGNGARGGNGGNGGRAYILKNKPAIMEVVDGTPSVCGNGGKGGHGGAGGIGGKMLINARAGSGADGNPGIKGNPGTSGVKVNSYFI